MGKIVKGMEKLYTGKKEEKKKKNFFMEDISIKQQSSVCLLVGCHLVPRLIPCVVTVLGYFRVDQWCGYNREH